MQIPSGMEMIMTNLRRMIPEAVWELVMRNATGVMDTVKVVDQRLERIEQIQGEILKRLPPLPGEAPDSTDGVYPPISNGAEHEQAPHAPNGHS